MFFTVVLWLVDLEDGGTTHYTCSSKMLVTMYQVPWC